MKKYHFITATFLILFITINNVQVIAQTSDSFSLKQNPDTFKVEKFWKGNISAIPHSLYRGSGLARDGSFFMGEGVNGSLEKINIKRGKGQSQIYAGRIEEYAFASVVSPDNEKVACSWFNGNFFDLIMVPSKLKNGSLAQPRLLIKGSPDQSAIPYDWSPDGKWVLTRFGGFNKAKIALVSVNDGSVKVVKEMLKDWMCNKISFSPDGQYIIYDYPSFDGQSDIHLIDINGYDDQILVKDAGYAPYWSPDGNFIFFIYKNDSNQNQWNLWTLRMSKTKAIGKPLLIKEGINFFAPLGFINDNSFLYGESSSVRLNVYIAELGTESIKIQQTPALISKRYPEWNVDPVWSSDGKYISYNSKRKENQNAIVIQSTDTGQEEDIMTSPGSLIQWFPDNSSLLIRAQGENGSILLYRLSVKTKDTIFLYDLKPDKERDLFREKPILSADGKSIFFFESNYNHRYSKVMSLNLETKAVREIAVFDSPDITSFSASPDGKYLGMIILYQQQAGRPSALRVITLQSGEVRDLFKEPWGDATKFHGLGWSPDSRYIYYIRNNVQTAQCNLWRAPVVGGQPHNTGIAMTDLRMPKIHPDGKHIVYSGGEGWYKKIYEVKAIKVTSHRE